MVSKEDEQIGAQIRELRLAEGLSQSDLAERMTDFGQPMQQQTVLKIEKGTRSLKLAEAVAMAACLRTFVNNLVPPENDAKRVRELVSTATASRKQGFAGAEALYDAEVLSAHLQQDMEGLSEDALSMLPDIVLESAGMTAEQIFKRHMSVVRKLAEDPDWDGTWK